MVLVPLPRAGLRRPWPFLRALPLLLVLTACSHGAGLASPTLALRLLFDEGSPTLSADLGPEIDDLANSVAAEDNRFVVLASFAGEPNDNAERMLALSLARVLAVRARLMTGGVSTKRIIVRACGVRDTEAPRERVDVYLADGSQKNPSFCGPKPDLPLPLGPDEDGETLSI